MDPTLKTQLDIKQNAEELQKYISELHDWEKQMKIMEKKLSGHTISDEKIPPPRNSKKRGSDGASQNKEIKKRISGSDYKAWDKFDADGALKDEDEKDSCEPESIAEEKTETELKNKVNATAKAKTVQSKQLPIEEDVDMALAEKEMGNKFVKEGKWVQAERCYSKAIALHRNNPVYHANRALCYIKLSKFKAAEVDSTIALQLDPEYVKAYQRRGFSRKALHQYEEAKADYQKVLKLEPNNAEARSEVMKLEKLITPKQNFAPFDPRKMFEANLANEIEKQIDVKKSPVKNIEVLSPADIGVKESEDLSKAKQKGDNLKQVKKIEEIIPEVEPENKKDTELQNIDEAFVQKELGNKYVKEGKWSDGLKCYSKSILLHPNNAVYHANRALCYLKLTRFAEAESDCSIALSIDPTYVKALQRRGFARKLLFKYSEALVDYQKVLELEPNNTSAKTEVTAINSFLASTANVAVEGSEQSTCTKNGGRETVDVLRDGDKICKVSPFKIELPAGCSKIDPISKPIHLRSKKPLKSIVVNEVADSEGLNKCLLSTTQEKSDETPEKAVNKGEEEAKAVMMEETVSRYGQSEAVDVPDVPKTCVQFEKSWKSIKHNHQVAYQYLKKIPLETLPRLFGSTLETELLSDLISGVSQDPFLQDPRFLFSFLQNLTKVERFSSLVLFLSDKDASGLKRCFQVIQASKIVDEDKFKALTSKFDMV